MVLVSIYNVTSEKELMLQLQDTKEQLQQKNQVRQPTTGWHALQELCRCQSVSMPCRGCTVPRTHPLRSKMQSDEPGRFALLGTCTAATVA